MNIALIMNITGMNIAIHVAEFRFGGVCLRILIYHLVFVLSNVED